MPLTSKEKMRRYRERLKSCSEKSENVKAKDRERKRMVKLNMTQKKLNTEKKRNRKRVQEHRLRKKMNISGGNEANANLALNLMTPQTLGKAKQRAIKHLPKSPRKRQIIIKELASDAGLISKENETLKAINKNTLAPELEEKVKSFFMDTSWVCPGKKDFLIVRRDNKKMKLQKHYLLSTLKEAYGMFKLENEEKIGFSKFVQLRPKQVLLQHDVPHNSCLCKYHENIRLLLIALYKVLPYVPTGFREFCSLVVCDQKNEVCMYSMCPECPQVSFLRLTDEFEEVKDLYTEWFQWESEDGRAIKTVRSGTVSECFYELEEQTAYFLQHTFTKREQAESFKLQKLDVQNNNSKILIQVDFAENFTTKNQDEIQSAYWSYKQVTLFTVCAWDKQKVYSMVIVSDYMAHDKYAVITFLRLILSKLEEYQIYNEVVIFSDGVSSQFKQKYLLCALSHMKRNITWQFFATSHGKGAVDGIGGEVKRIVSTAVLTNVEHVANSLDFTRVAKTKCQKIEILHCSSAEVQSNFDELDNLWKGILPVPSIRGIHFVKVITENVIEIRKLASSTDFSTHDFKKKKELEQPLSVESCDEPNSAISSGNWVLVRYPFPGTSSSQKIDTTFHFIGQVLSTDSRLQVKYLKKIGTQFIWPLEDDLDFIQEQDVVMTLPEPQMNRRGYLNFQNYDDFANKYIVK